MYPELKESTVRGMRLKYEEELRNALKEKRIRDHHYQRENIKGHYCWEK